MDLRGTFYLTMGASQQLSVQFCPVRPDRSVTSATSPPSHARFRFPGASTITWQVASWLFYYYYFIIIYTNFKTQFPFNVHLSKLEYPAPGMWCKAVITTFILLSSVLESVYYFILWTRLFHWSCYNKCSRFSLPGYFTGVTTIKWLTFVNQVTSLELP